jgi:phage terminase small subunit
MPRVPVPTEDLPAKPWHEGLTDKERRFVDEYLVDLNARRAALRCNMGRGNVKSATEVGSRLKRKLAANISAALAEKSGITATALVSELGAIAYSRITDFLRLGVNGRLVLAVSDLNELPDEAKAAIAKIKERVNDDGTISIEVELWDKLSAIDRIGRAIGLFQEHVGEVNHKHKHEFVDPLDRIKERLNALRNAQGLVPEIDPPLKRITPPQPTPRDVVIDAD